MRLGHNSYIPHRLDWAEEQKARSREADANPRTYRGREFTRTLALACPWCSNVFFVWQAVGCETQPYDDPGTIQPTGKGQRYTCGHPICWDREQVYQMKQTEDYKNTCENYWKSKEPQVSTTKPKAKLTKLGG